MARLVQCDVCGDIIPLNTAVHEMILDHRQNDVCPRCAEELRLWMIARYRGPEPKRGEEAGDG